jgi:hypothetical protein
MTAPACCFRRPRRRDRPEVRVGDHFRVKRHGGDGEHGGPRGRAPQHARARVLPIASMLATQSLKALGYSQRSLALRIRVESRSHSGAWILHGFAGRAPSPGHRFPRDRPRQSVAPISPERVRLEPSNPPTLRETPPLTRAGTSATCPSIKPVPFTPRTHILSSSILLSSLTQLNSTPVR